MRTSSEKPSLLPGRGRLAAPPQEIPLPGWKDVLWRTWQEVTDDRVLLIAAGATFYLLLALVPTLTAFVSLYGLFSDASTVNRHAALLAGLVPAGGLELLDEQLTRLTQQKSSTLGWGLVLSLALALWSASSGVKTMFEAMNVAYDEHERRGFFRLNALALVFTLLGLLGGALMLGVVVVLPAALTSVGFAGLPDWTIQATGYFAVAALLFAGIAALYRFGPSRQEAKWRWLTPGAILAVGIILAASGLFSWYSANFANYEKTYGSLGGLIGFLTWIWISVAIVVVGAELNAEAEHQRTDDSTVGADAPMGAREATMADTLGKTLAEGGDTSKPSAKTRPLQAAGQRHGGGWILPVLAFLFVLDRRKSRTNQ